MCFLKELTWRLHKKEVNILMNIYLLLIIVFIAVVISYMSINRDCFSPPTILSVSFIVPICLAILNRDEWGLDLDFETVLIIFVGITSFYVGFMLFFKKDKSTYSGGLPNIMFKKYTHIVYCFGLIYTMFSYYAFVQSMPIGGSLSEKLLVMRMMGNAENLETPSILENLFIFYKCTSLIYVYNVAINKILYNKIFIEGVLVTILTIGLTLMTGARGDAFFTIVAYGVVVLSVWEYWKKKKMHFSPKNASLFLGSIMLGLVLFYFSIFFVGRADMDDMDGHLVSEMIQYLSGYMGGEIKGLNDYVLFVHSSLQSDFPLGAYTLESLYKWLSNHLGIYTWLEGMRHDYLHNYYFDRYGIMIGNVYTAYAPQYEDGELLGVMLFNFVEGMFFGYMYYNLLPSKITVDSYGISWILLFYASFYYTIPLTFFAGFFYIMFSFGIWKIFAFIWMFEKIGLSKIREKNDCN